MQVEWEETLDTIFAAIVIGGLDLKSTLVQEKRDVYKMALPYFRGIFKDNVFEEEYAILYSIIIEHKIGIFTENQLRTIIDENSTEILNSETIHLKDLLSSVMDESVAEKANDNDLLSVFADRAVDRFIKLSNKVVTIDEFRACCQLYIELYKKEEYLKIIGNCSIITAASKRLKNSRGRYITYSGVDGAKKYYVDAVQVLNRLSGEVSSQDEKRDAEWLKKQAEVDSIDDIKLIKTGLDEIDNTIGYFCRTQMLGILGPTKGGKTRFTVHLVERLLEAGLNVAIWILEGSKEEWDSMIESRIIMGKHKISIDSQKIKERTYCDNIEDEDKKERYRQLVESAMVEYAIGEGRGQVSFINEMLYIEDYQEKLISHFENVNPFDVIVIDSPLIVQSLRMTPKTERITNCYESLKLFLEHGLPKKIGAICTAQIKQSVIDDLRRNPDDDLDVTSGGEAAATIRTPDTSIGLFSSKDEREAGIMRFYCVASRHSVAFRNFKAKCSLGSCFFESDSSMY